MVAPATRTRETSEWSGLVRGRSPAIRSLEGLIADVARTDIPLLLLGESGSGKDVYARYIHRCSQHSTHAFRKLSCALVDAETLVHQLRHFCVQDSVDAPGTLFIDGIDELDFGCQRALLSLLPDGDPTSDDGRIRTRLICSAAPNLEQEVTAGRFRRELYFRINGVCLRLPPLRERKEDIPELLEFLLLKHSADLNGERPAVTDEATEVLTCYPWPGNVRELENIARKIVALGDAGAAIRDLRSESQENVRETEAPLSSFKAAARTASRRTERELILKALKHTNWNRKRAAQELNISYKSLLYKIKQITAQDTKPE